MRDYKPGEETNGTIGQDEIVGNPRTLNSVGANGLGSWIRRSSWFPGFLIDKRSRFKFLLQFGR